MSRRLARHALALAAGGVGSAAPATTAAAAALRRRAPASPSFPGFSTPSSLGRRLPISTSASASAAAAAAVPVSVAGVSQPLGTVRHDWTTAEMEALYDRPLLDLVFDAASVHRRFHDPRQARPGAQQSYHIIQQLLIHGKRTYTCTDVDVECVQGTRAVGAAVHAAVHQDGRVPRDVQLLRAEQQLEGDHGAQVREAHGTACRIPVLPDMSSNAL